VRYPTKFHKHPRLPGHDYTHGSYFVTLCTNPRKDWFGRIVGTGPDAVMEPNELGQIVLDDWNMGSSKNRSCGAWSLTAGSVMD
jgi:hypothetical protein